MRKTKMNLSLPYPSVRQPIYGDNIVATSQPLAAQAGLAMLAKGGNAIDATIAAAMALTVTEPTGCGIGSDAFAIVWDGEALHGLNASGRSPAGWTHERFADKGKMPERGWDSVTVPGAVSAWIALWERFGSLPLDVIAEPAVRYAEDGFPLSPTVAKLWKAGAEILSGQPGFRQTFLANGDAPHAGSRVRLPDHGATLRMIAESRGEAFYRGELARRIALDAEKHGAVLSERDLAAHKAEWTQTISTRFQDSLVHELPPNGQGIATLIGLGILDRFDFGSFDIDSVEAVHLAIEATKLALVDVDRHVADIDAMRLSPDELLAPSYLDERAKLVDRNRAGDPKHGAPKPGGTVYLTVADAQGRMVSFIQSNYMGFGSGVVVPGTGISLQNRGAGFTLERGHPNVVAPGKRPFHTIIPGFATDLENNPVMSFGVMGGPMQAQGHLQMALRVIGYGQNPQAAADAPRWRVMSGRKVAVESSFDMALVEKLRSKGHDIVVESPDAVFGFGGAQIVVRSEDGYVAGSDPRKDGQAVAF